VKKKPHFFGRECMLITHRAIALSPQLGDSKPVVPGWIFHQKGDQIHLKVYVYETFTNWQFQQQLMIFFKL
jgi:hypothetical protein